jgi:hypothetical protein
MVQEGLVVDSDLILVVGIIAGTLAIPALLSAYSESRAPRSGAILVLISGVLLAVALTNKGGGYRLDDVPEVFMSVIKRYIG